MYVSAIIFLPVLLKKTFKTLKIIIMKKILVVSFLALIGIRATSQTVPACPSLDLGPYRCASPCATINATIKGANATTSYTVASTPYSLQSLDGTLINNHIDDIWSPVINLGFSFCYYGTTYSQICVGANGMVTFDLSKANTTNQWKIWDKLSGNNYGNIPDNTICALWRDIDPSIAGTTYIKTVGTAPCRSTIISWANTPLYHASTCTPAPAVQTFQLVLYENSNFIDVNIQRSTSCSNWNGGLGIIGLYKNSTTSLPAPGRDYPDTWSVTNESWRFTPNGAAPTPTITWSGPNGVIGTGTSINVCPTTGTIYSATTSYTNCAGTIVYLYGATYVNGRPNANFNTSTYLYPGYFTFSATPLDVSQPINWDFNYCWRVEGWDATYTNQLFRLEECLGGAWTSYPSAEFFKGFDNITYPYSGNVNPALPSTPTQGKFKYNYYYKIVRVAANGECGWSNEAAYYLRVVPAGRLANGQPKAAKVLISDNPLDVMGDVSTGINDAEVTSNIFTVFPNPSNGIFTINLNNENKATMEVVDITGKVIKTAQLNKNDHYILDLSGYAKGQYMIKMNGEHQQLQKIVIE
jgi:hypothetical protein